jgi:hypothetical protein
MARLPYSRIVDVSLTKLDRFARRRGFGIPLILTSDDSGDVDATTRTKVYGTMEEVADDYASTTEPYKAALAMFSQTPRPLQIKIGFIDDGVLDTPTPSPTIGAELDAVYAYDNDWYWLTMTSEFRDNAILDAVMAWVDAKPALFIIASNAAGHEDPANTTALAPRNKGIRQRSAVFYHPTAAEYPDAAFIAVLSRFNFDQRNSAYTGKFKKLVGITPANIASAAVQGATGFVPAIGVSTATGHLANVYVDIGGINMTVEGTMLDGGFIDELHFADWLIARTEEELLSTLANQPGRVPYTNAGMQILVAAVESVMQRAVIAGAIGDSTDPTTGELSPAYDISVERVEDVPESQRRQRIAPAVDCRFRIAGAVHYATARFFLSF